MMRKGGKDTTTTTTGHTSSYDEGKFNYKMSTYILIFQTFLPLSLLYSIENEEETEEDEREGEVNPSHDEDEEGGESTAPVYTSTQGSVVLLSSSLTRPLYRCPFFSFIFYRWSWPRRGRGRWKPSSS